MKGIEFALFPNGWGQNDAAWNFAGYNFATAAKKDRGEAWMTFPLQCVVIKHPEAGYIMYDVGCGAREEIDRRPEEHRLINPVMIKRDEYVDQRLMQLGLCVNDISTIIISHCHWDHIGGLEFFKGTPAIKHIYVGKEEFSFALVASHKSSKGYSDALYYKKNLDVDGAEFNLIEEDIELFPDVKLILFEGHSPCVIGLMLHLENSTYIFPSDAVTAEICYKEPIVRPGTIYDSLGFDRTLKRLRKLEKEYDANIIFHHDPWNFPNYRTMEWIR
ncbi:N-acyl homoserine lactonase family protein [Sediminispirochaeta smaragdinae]|uniref:Beta-lactamase-like protein n=1 Tax=Sediminispirochaeta smaragdinae (strain DSM 11293 / JCM 15392 / SEBR 4228) TaxID=573413 RepID=E1R8N5_SEDSS|nr:N-acyl homoserine lactonase family protein [Sediminispirochaeta smaragdinae]ADK81792.1 beta-lactamase-like protein [Sediminispirochaeta smaragdinae DSM 11293]